MKCSKAEVYISKWADNDLDKQKIIKVSDHIKECKECKEFSSDIFLMTDKLSKLPLANPSPLFLKRSLSMFDKNRSSPGFFTWWRFAGPEIKAVAISFAAVGILIGFIFANKTIDIDLNTENSPYYLAVNSSTGDLY